MGVGHHVRHPDPGQHVDIIRHVAEAGNVGRGDAELRSSTLQHGRLAHAAGADLEQSGVAGSGWVSGSVSPPDAPSSGRPIQQLFRGRSRSAWTSILTCSAVHASSSTRAAEQRRGRLPSSARPASRTTRLVAEAGARLEARRRASGTCSRIAPIARRAPPGSMQTGPPARRLPWSYSTAPLLAITIGCAPGRSAITSSQRTGRPVANTTGMSAACAAWTAAAFSSLTVPSGDRKVPSRSVTISRGRRIRRPPACH